MSTHHFNPYRLRFSKFPQLILATYNVPDRRRLAILFAPFKPAPDGSLVVTSCAIKLKSFYRNCSTMAVAPLVGWGTADVGESGIALMDDPCGPTTFKFEMISPRKDCRPFISRQCVHCQATLTRFSPVYTSSNSAVGPYVTAVSYHEFICSSHGMPFQIFSLR